MNLKRISNILLSSVSLLLIFNEAFATDVIFSDYNIEKYNPLAMFLGIEIIIWIAIWWILLLDHIHHRGKVNNTSNINITSWLFLLGGLIAIFYIPIIAGRDNGLAIYSPISQFFIISSLSTFAFTNRKRFSSDYGYFNKIMIFAVFVPFLSAIALRHIIYQADVSVDPLLIYLGTKILAEILLEIFVPYKPEPVKNKKASQKASFYH